MERHNLLFPFAAFWVRDCVDVELLHLIGRICSVFKHILGANREDPFLLFESVLDDVILSLAVAWFKNIMPDIRAVLI